MASDLTTVSSIYLECIEWDILMIATEAMEIGVLVFHRKVCEGGHSDWFGGVGEGQVSVAEVLSDFGACYYISWQTIDY